MRTKALMLNTGDTFMTGLNQSQMDCATAEANNKKQFMENLRQQELKQARVKQNRESNFKSALAKF